MAAAEPRVFLSTTAGATLWHTSHVVVGDDRPGAVCGERRATVARGDATPQARAKLVAWYEAGQGARIATGKLAGALEPCLRCEAKLRGRPVASFVAAALEHRPPR